MEASKNVLVLGGTGAMGKHVVKFLVDRGFKITVTSRSERENKNSIEYIKGNAKELTFITKLCETHWDAIIDFMIYTIEELKERIDLLLSSTDQYLFISSARVYADTPLINEDSPRLLDVCQDKEYFSTNEYALAKAKEENVLFNSEYKNWTIVRPSLTYAENRLQLGVYEKENWLYRALHNRSIVFSEDLMERYYTLSYGKDVADGIAGLIGNSKAVGLVFPIVIEESFQWKDILEIYLKTIEKCTGKKPKVVLTEKSTNLDLPYAKYQVLYGRYFNRHFDNSKIKSIVDTSEWKKPEEGLALCLEEFLKNPQFSYIDWHKEALIDKAAKEFTPLKEIPGWKMRIKYLMWRIL